MLSGNDASRRSIVLSPCGNFALVLFDFFRASAAALARKQSSAPELIDDSRPAQRQHWNHSARTSFALDHAPRWRTSWSLAKTLPF